jgi:hypothetical protein
MRLLRQVGVRAMELAFSHAVRYTAAREVTISEVAGSLVATEDAIARIPRILELLYPGLTIDATTLRLSQVRQLSPSEENSKGRFPLNFKPDWMM